MPRSQGTSRKGKPGKLDRDAGMGKALQRSTTGPRHKGERHGMARRAGVESIGEEAAAAAELSHNNTKSILERNDLDDFLHQADLASREFVSEREYRVVLDSTARAYVPGLNQRVQHEQLLQQQHASTSKFVFQDLSVPRRPAWDETTTKQELDTRERDAFLEWRRAIAMREEQLLDTHASVTPFEKNLEVWRQLWRVLERSACLLQLLDARNPLFYLSQDLKDYANSLGKPMMILINKADYLSEKQRQTWSDYLVEQGWEQPVFFSAAMEQEKLDLAAKEERKDRSDVTTTSLDGEEDSNENDSTNDGKEEQLGQDTLVSGLESHGIRVPLTRQELTDFLLQYAQSHGCQPDPRYDNRIQFGMVGFPNVGKSSVINVLMGNSKHTHGKTRVGVASQPGKTKHFQTLILSDGIMLCDCPGLVFPSFVSNTADLIAAGVYPVAQMRDFWPVISLICQRIPPQILCAQYGISLPHSRPPTPQEFLDTFCIARSLLASASGVPDHQRASRMIVKDYAVGKLLYCHPPPASDKDIFMQETTNTMLQNTEKLRKKLSAQAVMNPEGGETDPVMEPEFGDSGILDLLDMGTDPAVDEELQLNKHGKMSKKGRTPKQKWGKKDRKKRDKDPYGCHSDASAVGTVVSGGRNGQVGYTRPVTYPTVR